MNQKRKREVNSFDYLYGFFYAFLASLIPLLLLLFNKISLLQFSLIGGGVFIGYMVGVHLKYKRLNQMDHLK